ncbi:hypothetical protein BDN70DRAFT_767799, partial [Pholiota conissans]
LTLHMHMMLWIKGAFTPQQIRDRIMSHDTPFQKALISYLESAHQGEFITGSMDEIKAKVPMPQEGRKGVHSIKTNEPCSTILPGYKDPTQTLPSQPPPLCTLHSDNVEHCDACLKHKQWWELFDETVDDLLCRSNIHKCRMAKSKGKDTIDGQLDKKETGDDNNSGPKGCLNKDGVCMARFPRDVYARTTVDENDGHIFMKKLEPMMNTFTPCLTYLLRANSDITSLLSGTSIKAIISYVTDYVTKPTLKTHQIFSSAYDVYDK